MTELEGQMTEASPSQPGDIRFHVFGRTDVGRIREHNEDSYIIANLTEKTCGTEDQNHLHVVGPHGSLLAVCDGMGGAAAGEVASALAVSIIYEKLAEGAPPTDHDELARRMVRAIETAGLRIYSEAKLDRHHRGMGTTATVAVMLDSFLFLGQVGDSRAYILRNQHLVQVTSDQSLVNQLIKAGQLTEEEAENFEHNNIILQALGTADTVQVDLTFVPLRQGDVLLMCSDGLSSMVRYDDIRQTMLDHPDITEACQTLIEKANDAGGHDNITVVLARFEGDGLPEPADDDPRLEYTNYVLPENSTSERAMPGRRGAVKELDEPMIGSEVKDRFIDPSQPRASSSNNFNASPKNLDDEVVLPIENTPLWVLAALVIAVFGGLAFAAYYFVHRQ